MERKDIGMDAQNRLVGDLRSLYESLGYTQYPMRRFEEYALYAENKAFLKSEQVLAFHNPDGKLMALKPDVTLSIVKRAKREPGGVEKLYYTESVYRVEETAHEFREIGQAGVEYLGDVDAYAVCEVVRLALESLRATGAGYVLNVSHMGFVGALMAQAGLTAAMREQAFVLLGQKNGHELRRLLGDSPEARNVAALADLFGAFPDTLCKARMLADTPELNAALDELDSLYQALALLGYHNELRLDFSIAGDLDYYNGVVFQGYVEGAPRVALSGGRYDRLMRKFGKQGDGVGFALYLNELSMLLSRPRAYDVDALVLYPQGLAPEQLADLNRQVWSLSQAGLRVLAAREAPADKRAARILRYQDGALTEVTRNA